MNFEIRAERWVEDASATEIHEIYALLKAVEDMNDQGMFECVENNGGYIVWCQHVPEPLSLHSEGERQDFLALLREHYGIEGGADAWYGYMNAIRKRG